MAKLFYNKDIYIVKNDIHPQWWYTKLPLMVRSLDWTSLEQTSKPTIKVPIFLTSLSINSKQKNAINFLKIYFQNDLMSILLLALIER